MNFVEIKKQAYALLKSKQFVEGGQLYGQLWEKCRTECDKWIGWGYAYCLYKNGDYSGALTICREVYKENSDFSYIKNVYAWCLYYTEIAVDGINEIKKFLQAADDIVMLTIQENYSPYMLTIFKVMEHYKNHDKYKMMLLWAEKLDVTLLDDTSVPYTDELGIVKEHQTRKEKYLVWCSKALLKEGKYAECIDLSEQALKDLAKLHTNNDVWFRRNMAKAYIGLGKYDEALDLLQAVICRKKDWFIYGDFSQLYYEIKCYDEALRYGAEAAIGSNGMLSSELLIRLAKLYVLQTHTDVAKGHIELACALRNAKQQHIDKNLLESAVQYGIDVNNLPELNTLLRSMKNSWCQTRDSMRLKYSGKITRMIQENRAGFIKGNDNIDYYFTVQSFNGNKSLLQSGLRVQFFVEDSFDRKKNRMSKVAVNIRENQLSLIETL